MEKSDAYRKGSGSGKKWDGGGPGGSGGGPYGGGPGGPRGPRGGLDNVRGLDSIRGADHSKFTSTTTFDFDIFQLFSSAFPLFLSAKNSLVHFPDSLPACGSCCG